MAEHSWQNVAARVDRTLGDGLERRVASHHRRRLAGLGWGEALAPGPGGWAAGSPPPRQGNSLELLVDGETALPRFAEALVALRDKLLRPPSPDFRLLLLLPSRANSGEDDTQGQLGVLAEADRDGRHLLACTIYARSAGVTAAPVYVHAKVGIVDDDWLTIGSANLNDHSLFNDTEVNVVTHDPAVARSARIRLWSEHLEMPADETQGDPVEIIDTRWRPIATEQQELREAGEAMTHRLARLPHVSKRLRRLLGPLDGVVVDG
jgi:PLD-like domain